MTSVNEMLKSKAQAKLRTIKPQASVYEALEAMAQHDIGALPVVEAEKLVGIFTERDYARKVILKGLSSKNTPLRELMTRDVICVTPDQTVERCMWLMTDKRIRHLPVLEQDQLIGLVSIGDVLKALVEQQAHTIKHLITPGGDLLDQ
jgi:CBS domain-containing protein